MRLAGFFKGLEFIRVDTKLLEKLIKDKKRNGTYLFVDYKMEEDDELSDVLNSSFVYDEVYIKDYTERELTTTTYKSYDLRCPDVLDYELCSDDDGIDITGELNYQIYYVKSCKKFKGILKDFEELIGKLWNIKQKEYENTGN